MPHSHREHHHLADPQYISREPFYVAAIGSLLAPAGTYVAQFAQSTKDAVTSPAMTGNLLTLAFVSLPYLYRFGKSFVESFAFWLAEREEADRYRSENKILRETLQSSQSEWELKDAEYRMLLDRLAPGWERQ